METIVFTHDASVISVVAMKKIIKNGTELNASIGGLDLSVADNNLSWPPKCLPHICTIFVFHLILHRRESRAKKLGGG